jgi:hypothetical protein
MKTKLLKDFQVIIASYVNQKEGIGIEVWSKEKILIEIF